MPACLPGGLSILSCGYTMTMKMHFRWFFYLLLSALPLLVCTAMPLQAQGYSIEASASPARVTFDPEGANRSLIRVTVRDAGGLPAPNMTPVRFATNLGSIPAQANTQNGQVTVELTTQEPGRATVDVFAGESHQVLYVEFLGKGQTSAPPVTRPSYRLKAQQCYFSQERLVFDLTEGATFSTQAFTVTADHLQFDVRNRILTAQSSKVENAVTVTAGDKSFTAKELYLSIASSSGAFRDIDDEYNSHYKVFTIPELVPREEERAKSFSLKPLSASPTRTWILSSAATVFPGQQIQFRHAAFYLDQFDKCLLRLPYHVLDLGSSTANNFLAATVSLNTDAGLDVDFPLYYAANDSHIGSFHLRNVSKGSSFYRGVSGLQVSLEEEYILGDKADGALYLDDLTRPTRSLTFEHRQDIGGMRILLNTSYDRFDVDTPYSKRASMSMARTLGQVNVNLSTNWTAFDKDSNTLAELSAYLPALRFGHTGMDLAFSPYVGWTKTERGAKDTTPAERDTTYHEGLRASMGFPTIPFLGGAFSTNLSDEISHDSHGTTSNYLDTGLRYQRPIFRSFAASIGYSYGLTTSNTDTTGSEASRYLNLDISGRGVYWDLFGYASYNLHDESTYASTNFRYNLPWNKAKNGERRWFFEYGINSSFGGMSTTTVDSLFTVGRPIGSYTALVHYSPSGNNAVTGYGTGTGKKWAFELVRNGY